MRTKMASKGVGVLQAMFGLVAVVALTGAKDSGPGCIGGGSVIVDPGPVDPPPPPPPPPPSCPAGSHVEEICAGGSSAVGVGGGDAEYEFEEASCALQCVRDPACPAGYHEEESCSGSVVAATGVGGGDYDYDYDSACESTCVPDSVCPEGTSYQETCYGGSGATGSVGSTGPGYGTGGGYGWGEEDHVDCFAECVPHGLCPAGYYPVEICEDYGSSSYSATSSGSGPGTTTSTGVGGGYGYDEPSQPPMSCWTECYPEYGTTVTSGTSSGQGGAGGAAGTTSTSTGAGANDPSCSEDEDCG